MNYVAYAELRNQETGELIKLIPSSREVIVKEDTYSMHFELSDNEINSTIYSSYNRAYSYGYHNLHKYLNKTKDIFVVEKFRISLAFPDKFKNMRYTFREDFFDERSLIAVRGKLTVSDIKKTVHGEYVEKYSIDMGYITYDTNFTEISKDFYNARKYHGTVPYIVRKDHHINEASTMINTLIQDSNFERPDQYRNDYLIAINGNELAVLDLVEVPFKEASKDLVYLKC